MMSPDLIARVKAMGMVVVQNPTHFTFPEIFLARYGQEGTTLRALPKLSQETLAEMVGTTRSRVNFFMNKFRKLGLIEYNGGLKVNSALLSIVLHD